MKKKQIWIFCIWFSGILLSACIFFCIAISKNEEQKTEISSDYQDAEQKSPEQEEAETIMELCSDLYEKAADENRLDDLAVIRSIVNRLGENGYTAVDSENQINMTNADNVTDFCEKVQKNESGKLTIIEVNMLGAFTKYDLETKAGEVEVVRTYCEYENMENVIIGSYKAENWKYTEEGYLIFSGTWFSEDLYVLNMSGQEDHVALRVQPLDENCRELNRKYLLSVGYERNNMFLVNWSETDFGTLNFYDVFDVFYPAVYGQAVPYTVDQNLSVGRICQISEQEFEHVIMSYFRIESSVLQSKTIYDSENTSYEYKPRGFYEVEYPEYPYPEVVNYTENADGTVSLLVNVVFPYTGNSKVYAHKVTVRPMGGGAVQYVSNKVIESEKNTEVTWHKDRLTEDEWEELYGTDETDTAYWVIPESEECLLSVAERKDLQKEAILAAEQVASIYKNAEFTEGASYSSGVKTFSREQRRAVVRELGRLGKVSVEEDTNMENHEEIETFYAEYLRNEDAAVTVYEVQPDGLIGATTFIYRQGKLQTYYVGICWKEGAIPEIQGTLVSDVAEIKLTEKGYFIYAYKEEIVHTGMRQYFRTEPLSDTCRELTEKYISGLSYVNYNLLVTDWDSSNVENILMPCMFSDIYRIDTGENFRAEGGKIEAGMFEKIMTTYFPVSAEMLRKYCGYDADTDSYQYERVNARPYPPFGEVVDYTENADGTITLFVDGVWPDYNSDYAFTNRIVVQPFEDGTFRYLSNHIEQKELEIP